MFAESAIGLGGTYTPDQVDFSFECPEKGGDRTTDADSLTDHLSGTIEFSSSD